MNQPTKKKTSQSCALGVKPLFGTEMEKQNNLATECVKSVLIHSTQKTKKLKEETMSYVGKTAKIYNTSTNGKDFLEGTAIIKKVLYRNETELRAQVQFLHEDDFGYYVSRFVKIENINLS